MENQNPSQLPAISPLASFANTDKTDHAEPHRNAERRPFVEPAVTPAGDIFEVTKNFLFMMQQSSFSGGGDGGDL